MSHCTQYEVIVIGGGHAGTEAALAAARIGAKTLLLTHNIDTLGQMSCNPAIGGIGKGHLVKEIDALGGIMALASDDAGIQFRTLNASKGPAVRATRAQADRHLYKQAIRSRLEQQENLHIFQQGVADLVVVGERVTGVVTQQGLTFHAPSVVLTVGTFLGGKIHIGDQTSAGGRAGDPPSIALAQRLRELPLRVGRLKTGTPPRIDGKSVDYSVMQAQPGDEPTPVFSFIGQREQHPQQVCCHITHTTERTRDIILANLDKSAMYSGIIEGVGPRYCPSIEDKVVRFADKLTHQIFVEPEGLHTHELYPNGISTSLPFAVQVDFVRSIKGFAQAHITRPGYAIEYDYFDPRDLQPSLETKCIAGLFFAGQINGTTGYEEAAAQGLLAGANAALQAKGQPACTLRRDQAYLGVLVDDLITQGTQEPYRMFTSRAEYRLTLREDNADLRLTELGRQLGLVDEHRWRLFCEKREAIEQEKQRLRGHCVRPNTPVGDAVASIVGKALPREFTAYDLLKRPELTYRDLTTIAELGPWTQTDAVAEQVTTQIKYDGYIERQQADIAKQQKLERTQIPSGFDYAKVSGLSNEVLQKLTDVQPTTIAQAARISGVTPAAVSLLLVYLKKHRAQQVA